MGSKKPDVKPFETTNVWPVILVSIMVVDQEAMKDVLDQIEQYSAHKVLMRGYVPFGTDINDINWGG